MKMKQMSVVLFGLLIMSSAAFAQDYPCGLLKDFEGHGIYGGPGYTVEINGQDVVLYVSSLVSHTVEYRMEKTAQEPDGAIFEAEGVTASIFTSPMGGKPVTSVSISKEIGNKTYSTNCNSERD